MSSITTYGRVDALFRIAAFISLLAGLFFFYASGITVNVHGTYFIISRFHVAFFLSAFFFFCSLIYSAFSKWQLPLNRSLACLHFVITVASIPAILIMFGLYPWDMAQRYHIHDAYNPFTDTAGYTGWLNLLMDIAVVLLILAQLLFSINIIMTLVRRRNA